MKFVSASKDDGRKLLQKQLDQIQQLRKVPSSRGFERWRQRTLRIVKNIFGKSSAHLKLFDSIRYGQIRLLSKKPGMYIPKYYLKGLDRAESTIRSFIDELEPKELNHRQESRVGTRENYVFVSHSSKDRALIDTIKQTFEDLPVRLYFVEDKTAGVPPSREIAEGVKKARALFVFFTSNVVFNAETRDWILFEIGVAVGHGIPIFSWKDSAVMKEHLPRLLEQVSKYKEFNLLNSEGILKLIKEIKDAANGL